MELGLSSLRRVPGALRLLVLTLPFSATAASAASGGPLFNAPKGWIDLSPSVQAKALRTVPPEVASFAKSRGSDALFVAAKLDSHRVLESSVVATLVDGDVHSVTEDYLAEQVGWLKGRLYATPGGDCKVSTTRLLDVRGATIGEFVLTMRVGAEKPPIGEAGFLLPTEQGIVLMLFITTPELLSAELSVFEQTARSVKGLTKPAKR